MIRYLIYVDHEKTLEGELSPGEHIAGRSHSADIHLSEPDVSGKHLKLLVTPEGIFAENLSSHGTIFQGNPLDIRRKMNDGDVLCLGKKVELHLKIQEDDPIPEAGEMKTVIPAAPSPASADDPDKTAVPPRQLTKNTISSPDDRNKTQIPLNNGEEKPLAQQPPQLQEQVPSSSSALGNGEEVLKTDVMRTRLASLEEMNLLRNADRKRSTGKLFKYILGGIGAIAVLVLLYSLKSSPKEVNLSWPVGPDGKELGAFTDPGNGGHKAGAFSLAYPSIKGKTEVEQKEGRITISTRFGKDASVPLRIIFIQKQSADFLYEDRKQVFSSMLSDLQQDNKRWNLAQISDVFFIGSENGLPCLSVEYRREADNESWYGEILFFRTGDQAYLRMAETPVSERARGQNFISNTPFLKFSLQYLQGHWEGNPDYRGGADTSVMLDEVSKHLAKQAPFEWARTYLLLQNTLMESVRNNNPALMQNALTQLRRLRSMQTIWYNSQKIQYFEANLKNDRQQEIAVLELCKTVFSSPDDLRYFTLRRNVWE